MVHEKYQLWLNAKLPLYLKDELKAMDEQQIFEAFYTDLSFGTAGLRGLIGAGTNRINEIVVRKITKGYANYLNSNFANPSVAISYDNRLFSKEFAYTAAKVLAANNIKSFIYPELRPTPMLSFLTRYYNTSGGIMITASHNPKEYNGYKIYESYGGQLTLDTSEKVINEIEKITDIFNIDEIDNELITWVDLDIIDGVYLNEVKKISFNNFKDKATILYSPLHGTGGTVIPRVLKELGYNIFVYEPHSKPDPLFSNTKSANPEEEIAYVDLIPYALEINADIIVLTDPDADRIGVAVRNNKDEYIVLNGNQTAVITLKYILDNLKDIENGYVFMSNVTTNLIKKMALNHNLNVIETLPGFKFIAEQIGLMDDDSTYVFGCEESNGSIIKEFVRDKDAVQATLMLAELASFTKSNNKTILDYLNEIYQEFNYFTDKTLSFSFKGASGKEKMDQLMTHFRKNKLYLPNNKLVVFEDYLNNIGFDLINNKTYPIKLPTSNVLKFMYEDDSWVMVRPSGTEPKLKIYVSTNNKSESIARTKLEEAINLINNIVNKSL